MWAQIINSILGLWLMAAPGIFGWEKSIADNDHIIGPIIVTFAVIAYWECTRNLRKANMVLGAWLLLAPWILGYGATGAIINDMLVGALVIGFSTVRGKKETRFGGGWKAVFKSDTLHAREARERAKQA